jgi:hypothetical protein
MEDTPRGKDEFLRESKSSRFWVIDGLTAGSVKQ